MGKLVGAWWNLTGLGWDWWDRERLAGLQERLVGPWVGWGWWGVHPGVDRMEGLWVKK